MRRTMAEKYLASNQSIKQSINLLIILANTGLIIFILNSIWTFEKKIMSITEFEVPNEIKILYAGIQGLLKISPHRENDE